MKQITTPLPSGADYLPVVLVRQNLESFARARDIALEESADDLDVYTMAHLISDSGCQFLLVHYVVPTGTRSIFGYPPMSATMANALATSSLSCGCHRAT